MMRPLMCFFFSLCVVLGRAQLHTYLLHLENIVCARGVTMIQFYTLCAPATPQCAPLPLSSLSAMTDRVPEQVCVCIVGIWYTSACVSPVTMEIYIIR